MDYLENQINQRLQKKEAVEKKQIVISVSSDNLEKLDAIAYTISKNSGCSTSRNMLIDDAIEACIRTSLKTFEEKAIELETAKDTSEFFDTVVFPAHEGGFRETFLDENKWYHVRVKADRIPKIKYVAIYVGTPISGITHYAKVDASVHNNGFEWDEDEEKYIIHFDGQAIELEHKIPLGDASSASVRAPRYTTREKLLTAESYADL